MKLKKMMGVLMKICSNAPYLGLIPKASDLDRESGISALVLLMNEPWIEPSLLSIKDFVDEFVVVDCSTDDTPRKVKQIAKEHGLNLKYAHMKPDYRKQLETAIKMSTQKWLLKWDGDFIAYLSGRRDIRKLKDFIGWFSKEKYYFIEFSILDVDLDLLHVRKHPYHSEAYLFKYSPLLMELSFPRVLRNYLRRAIGKRLPPRAPYLPFPFWYERIALNQVFVMHLRTVKSPLRTLERRYQAYWALLRPQEKQKYSNSFESYVQYRVKRDFNEENVKEAAQMYAEKLMRKWNLIPFRTDVYGDYPNVLKKMIKKTLDMEISQTEEFKNKLIGYLLST